MKPCVAAESAAKQATKLYDPLNGRTGHKSESCGSRARAAAAIWFMLLQQSKSSHYFRDRDQGWLC